MSWQYTEYMLPLLIAVVILLALAFYTWRHRGTPGAMYFMLLISAAAWWALMYALQLSGADLETKVFWAKAKYPGVVMLPVAWLAFALQYTGRDMWLTRRNLALLSIIPLITLALVATNDAHYLIWKPEMTVFGSFSVLHLEFGTWFWINMAYSYLLLVLGTAVLLRTIVPTLRVYYPQNLALLIGVMTPWISNAIYVSGHSPVDNLDLTPFAFTLSGLALAWGLLRYRLLDLVPVARSAIVERISPGIIVVDNQKRVVDINPAAQRILNRTSSMVLGRKVRELQPNLANLLERHRDKNEVREEVSFGTGSEHRNYDFNLSTLRDQKGNPSGRLILLYDITDHKRTEEQLRSSEVKFRTVVESIGEALLITDADDAVTFMNQRVTDLTGYTEEDMLGRQAYELFLPPEEWPEAFEHNRKRAQGISERYEMYLRCKDGEGIWTEINATPYRNAEGEIVGTLGAISDITERKASEKKLREAEELFRTTFDKTPMGMALVNMEGRYLRINEAMCQILGYSKQELLSSTFWEITYPEDYEKSMSYARRMWDGEIDSYSLEKRYQHAEGHPVWVCLSVALVRDSEGNPLHHIAQVQDISEQKRVEETLRESEQRFHQLFDQSVDSLLIHDVDGNIVDCNPEACRVHGYTREEMLTLSIKDLTETLLSEEERRARESVGGTLWQRAIAGDLSAVNTLHTGEHKRKDGTIFPVEVLVGSVNYAGQNLILASVRDITERKRAEEKLRESEQRYRSLVELSPDAIAVHSEGEILYINPAGAELFGASDAKELIGRKAMDFVHPDYRDVVKARIKRVLESEEPAPLLEEKYYRVDGSTIDVEVAGTPVNFLGKPAIQAVFRDITQRKQMEEALRENEERFRAIFENSGVGISIAELDRTLVQTNPAYQTMTGYSGDELLGKPIAELTHPHDVPADAKLNMKLLSGKLDRYQREKRYIRKDGEIIWVKPTVSVVRNTEGEPLFFVGVVEDITTRKRTEDALRESEERFRQLFEHSVDLLFVHDDKGKIVECNSEACRALGYTREELLSFNVGDIAVKLLSGEERRAQKNGTLWEQAMRSESGHIVGFEQNRLRRKDGTTFPVEVGVGAIDYGGRRMIFASARDISEHKELEEQLTYQAFHDPLTYLPNRALFLERLEHALARTSRRQSCVAVLYMDLDNFKVINDTLGHEVGDSLLKAVSERLKTCLRPEDTVARFGGDEFTMLLEDIEDTDEAKRVAERITEVLRTPFQLRQQEIYANITIGISVGTSAGDSPEDLLRKADIAMYEAKRTGKGQYVIFEPDMTIRLQERLELEGDLRRGVENDEFVVHYQPKITLDTGELYGFEALVRWEHPNRGIVPPKQFIPIAEETGLILPIEQKVLEDACHRIREWQEQYSSHLTVCVNLYERQIRRPDLIEKILGMLQEANLTPQSLMLEITEEVVMKDELSVLETLHALKNQGIKLAIDDFGTGYSSLDYLKRLPVDYLKIDGSFIEGLGEDHKDEVIVSAAIGLAHSLGLKVVAEGVETAEQTERLRELGCDVAQGHYFARALTKDQIPAFIISGTAHS